MADGWEYIDTGLSPWAAYTRYVVKNKPSRYSAAFKILVTLMGIQQHHQEYANGVPAHELVRALVPSLFKHETSAYRVIRKLVKYHVIERIPDPSGHGNKTYYSIRDPLSSLLGPQFTKEIAEHICADPYGRDKFFGRLLVQVHAAREVLTRHDLVGEWVSECNAFASMPVIESGFWWGRPIQEDEGFFGYDVGFLGECLNHEDPFRP